MKFRIGLSRQEHTPPHGSSENVGKRPVVPDMRRACARTQGCNLFAGKKDTMHERAYESCGVHKKGVILFIKIVIF